MGAARVICRATLDQPVSCHYRLVAASGTDLEASKTSSWGLGLRALDGGKPRRESFQRNPHFMESMLLFACERQTLVMATAIIDGDNDHEATLWC